MDKKQERFLIGFTYICLKSPFKNLLYIIGIRRYHYNVTVYDSLFLNFWWW